MRKSIPLPCLLLIAIGAAPLVAQVPDRAGAVRTAYLLRQLDGVKRVLMIAAHPDDENTSILATLSRGYGAETAYLALTRGEGGQNLIGPELEEGLGIVRTGELLSARSLDDGRQFFTRAFDFGYSKRVEEALALWPEEELLRDVTWIVRTFRPQVILSVFTGTPRDGHGQHQAAGAMAHAVFESAADPNRYPEQLTDGVTPWQATKLYRATWSNPEDASTELQTGVMDPLTGRSHHQVAMASRSQHRSQDMGVAQELGPQSSGLELIRMAGGSAESGDSGIFDGVDTAFVSIARLVPGAAQSRVRAALQDYRAALAEAREELDLTAPEKAVPALSRALTQIRLARAAAGGRSVGFERVLAERERKVGEALIAAAAVVVDVRSSDDIVVPGEVFRVDVEVWNGGNRALHQSSPVLELPVGARARPVEPPRPLSRFAAMRGETQGESEPLGSWDSSGVGEPRTVAPGSLEQWSFEVELSPDGPISELYYLRTPRAGAMYTWPDDRALWGLPRNPPLLPVQLRASVDPDEGIASLDAMDPPGTGPGRQIRAADERLVGAVWHGAVSYRGVDQAKGEFRRPLLSLPALSVGVTPGSMIWPRDQREARRISVAVESMANDPVRGQLRLEAPQGWTVTPTSIPFEVTGPGQSVVQQFEVVPPSRLDSGSIVFEAVARAEDGRDYGERVTLIDYEHIDRAPLFSPAEARVSVFPVQVARGLRVGYIMGAGDSGFEAIRQLGLDPVLLTPEDIEAGRYEGFDVIVLGIRVYETRTDLAQHNDKLLAWVRAGGVLITQYNQYQFARGDFAPYPVDIARPHDRVSVEEQPVTVLEPDSPVFNAPNRITDADWEGWVQERGLYFLSDWGEEFTPMLEMADPDEDPKRGALLVAPNGDGLYVYTGLSFFRQFPKGVPGAYRLFANLLSLQPRGVSE